MSEVQWWYEDAGKQAGPVTSAALGELVRAGRLPGGARVWRAGMPGWAAWEAVPELAALAPPPPAPAGPPPLSQGAPPVPPPPSQPQGWGAPQSQPQGWGAPGQGQGQPQGWSPPAAPPYAPGSYAADVLSTAGAAPLYPKAPFFGRLLAAIVDNLVSSIPAALLVIAAIAAGVGGSTGFAVLLGLLAVAAVLWAIWYSFTKDGRPGGASIGKKAMGLMVVHLPTNQPCDRSQSALRYLVLFGTNLVPYVGWLVEPIVLLVAAGGRRLGDQAAGTQVISASDYKRR